MPHCQKENHNHSTRSKKERQKAKQEATARKQRLREEQAAAEAEVALKLSNNIAPVEGHGEYEVGYEPEPEYSRFNVKKRSKKHLRQDLRKRMLREQEEEEERVKKQQEEDYRKQQTALEQDGDEEEEQEEQPPPLEYFVFICECCDKRYATKNQFLNHVNSKKHKRKCRIYEDLGLLVTHIELRGENGNEKEIYNDDDYDEDDYCTQVPVDNKNNTKTKSNDDDDDDENGNFNTRTKKANGNQPKHDESKKESEEESESDSDNDYVPPKRNMFTGFAATGFSSSSSDDDSDSDDDNNGDRKLSPARLKDPPPGSSRQQKQQQDNNDDDTIDFDELIYQNQLLQHEIDAQEQQQQQGAIADALPTPFPFHETYDPDDYDTNENRLASVQHRLRKNLAAKGIAPKTASATSRSAHDPLDAITMGKTLLQEVLQANIDTLQQKLDAYKKHKDHCQLMAKEFAFRKGNSKALPAQYVRKKDAADNARRRANVHHAGSHYHMQMARSMQFGRHKGMMARHSAQGARLQAGRMAAKETARMQQGGGGIKIGKKASKKSQQKRRGEAGGSKKNGGKKGDGGGGD